MVTLFLKAAHAAWVKPAGMRDREHHQVEKLIEQGVPLREAVNQVHGNNKNRHPKVSRTKRHRAKDWTWLITWRPLGYRRPLTWQPGLSLGRINLIITGEPMIERDYYWKCKYCPITAVLSRTAPKICVFCLLPLRMTVTTIILEKAWVLSTLSYLGKLTGRRL